MREGMNIDKSHNVEWKEKWSCTLKPIIYKDLSIQNNTMYYLGIHIYLENYKEIHYNAK